MILQCRLTFFCFANCHLFIYYRKSYSRYSKLQVIKT